MSLGRLLAIGGAAGPALLERFISLAGSSVVVVATASAEPDALEARYVGAFKAARRGHGPAAADLLPCGGERPGRGRGAVRCHRRLLHRRRPGADHHDHRRHADRLDAAGAGRLRNGDARRYQRGRRDDVRHDDRRRRRHVACTTGPGLEFLPGVLIDMHFAERGRLNRLIAAVARYPHELGLGIDEDTAILVEGDRFEVLGSGSVTVVDAGAAADIRAPGRRADRAGRRAPARAARGVQLRTFRPPSVDRRRTRRGTGTTGMKIISIRRLRGPNMHLSRPAVVARLDLGDLTGRETSDVEGFPERLLRALPGLAEHHCAAGAPGGFVSRMRGGTYFGHVTEHVCIELSQRIGREISFGRTVAAGSGRAVRPDHRVPGRRVAGVVPAGGSAAGRSGPGDRRHRGFDVSGPAAVRAVARWPSGRPPGRAPSAIIAAARRRGIPVERFADLSLLRLGWGNRRRLAWAAMTDRTGGVGIDIAGDKQVTRQTAGGGRRAGGARRRGPHGRGRGPAARRARRRRWWSSPGTGGRASTSRCTWTRPRR